MIIGLDVGGTHTDVVALSAGAPMGKVKVPTDASDLYTTVFTGLKQMLAQIDPSQVKRVVLSTTLTTNAVVQNKVPPVGMIVSAGPGLPPEWFRTGHHYYPVSGSVDHRGRAMTGVNEAEIRQAAATMKAEGIQHVGVVGKFSSRNPAHEIKIAEWLKPDFQNVFMGHQVSGNLNFPRRIATTWLNASVHALHTDFFKAVAASLNTLGLSVPIHILKADGGTMGLDASLAYPAQTILSGPAASVMGALAFAPATGDVVVLDIGGTTTDMAILIDGVPVLEPLGIEISGNQTLIRALRTVSVGIGGDSAVRWDGGNLTIGPDRLGPAMTFGGDHPTPTDALRVRGDLAEGDLSAATAGMETLAAAMGCDLAEAADRVFSATCTAIGSHVAAMVDAINCRPVYTIHEMIEGYQVSPESIVVLGAPARLFAPGLEAACGLPAAAVPEWDVANAIGAGLARTTCEVSLFADTEYGRVVIPEADLEETVAKNYTMEDAKAQAGRLLMEKAAQSGADDGDIDVDLLEETSFNMVRGFRTSGKNIRVKVQVKPGLINGYENLTGGH
ncbi:MAG: hydantoinase [Deltaproteobacteria bacterium]|nr:MAG: hydantoinase [Deltaproteobacteria bacterium]